MQSREPKFGPSKSGLTARRSTRHFAEQHCTSSRRRLLELVSAQPEVAAVPPLATSTAENLAHEAGFRLVSQRARQDSNL